MVQFATKFGFAPYSTRHSIFMAVYSQNSLQIVAAFLLADSTGEAWNNNSHGDTRGHSQQSWNIPCLTLCVHTPDPSAIFILYNNKH